MRLLASAFFLVLWVTSLFGEGIILNDGTILEGKIISTNLQEVVLESKIGTIRIAPHQIKTLVWDVSKSEDIAKTDFILTTNAVHSLILKGEVYSGPEILALQRYSFKLPEQEKLAIFSKYEMKDWYFYSALNLIPVLSIGTWAVGEWKTALLTGSGTLLFGGIALVTGSSADLKAFFVILAVGLYTYNAIYPGIYQWLRNEQMKIVLSMYPDRLHPSLKSQGAFPKLGVDGLALREDTLIFELPVFTASF